MFIPKQEFEFRDKLKWKKKSKMKNARIFVASEVIFHSVLLNRKLSVIVITKNSTSLKRWSPQNKKKIHFSIGILVAYSF